MARGKNEVTLTFAGDSDKLEKAFDKVGASAKTMGDDVGRASKDVRDTGASFDRVGEAADNVDTKAMGFRDTMTGVEDTGRGLAELMKGNLFEGFLTLGMGIGDLASGMFNFIIPAMKSFTLSTLSNVRATVTNTASLAANKVAMVASTIATKTMTVAQKALNLAMRMNPIGLVITALFAVGAALVLAYKKSETFRRIVDGAFRAVQRVASFAFNWIKNNWRLLLAIITGPIGLAVLAVSKNFDRIKAFARSAVSGVKSVFRGIGSALTAPFRSAAQGIRNVWNSTLGGRGFDVPGWVPGIGGRSFRIPRLHTGGIVPGAPGSESLALLQAGERVTPAGRSAGRTVIELRSDGSALGDALVEVLRNSIKIMGGDVQIALGSR